MQVVGEQDAPAAAGSFIPDMAAPEVVGESAGYRNGAEQGLSHLLYSGRPLRCAPAWPVLFDPMIGELENRLSAGS